MKHAMPRKCQDMKETLTLARRAWYAAPFLVFAALAVSLAIGLERDPDYVPSALIGEPVPHTSLPPVEGYGPPFEARDFKGRITLINVFASWCTSCLEEHPLLMEIASSGIAPVFGLAYKDGASTAWLKRPGNPYAATGADTDGRAGLEWGVRGVPETFVVDAEGIVTYKHVGPITAEVWRDVMAPLITGAGS